MHPDISQLPNEMTYGGQLKNAQSTLFLKLNADFEASLRAWLGATDESQKAKVTVVILRTANA